MTKPLAAAILHDTIEDTDTTADELRRLFGKRITDIVLEVTDDKALDKAERKRLQVEHAPHISRRAKLVKLADKICNLRDIAHSPPAKWPPKSASRQHYRPGEGRSTGLRGVHPKLGNMPSTRRSADAP